jgi:hypothetical protein
MGQSCASLRGQIVCAKAPAYATGAGGQKNPYFSEDLNSARSDLLFFKLFKRCLISDGYCCPWWAFVGGG